MVVSDQSKLVIFNSKSGACLSTIVMPVLYNTEVDFEDVKDYRWREETVFAFSENTLLVFHSRRNYPIAADVLLFW